MIIRPLAMLIGTLYDNSELSISDPIRIPTLVLDYLAKFTPLLLVSFITVITAFLAAEDSAGQETPNGEMDQENSDSNN